MYHWCYKIVKGDLVLQMGKLNDIRIQINCKMLCVGVMLVLSW